MGTHVVEKGQRGQGVMDYMKETKGMVYRTLWVPAIIFLVALVTAVQSQAGEVTDMFGRKFTISDRPQRVYSASPPTTNLLYAIDPGMLAGLNTPVRSWEKKYLRKSMQELPVLGGWFGQSNTPNIEMILRAKPEVIIIQNFGDATDSKTNVSIMKAVQAPVISINLTTVFDYPEAITFLGRLLGRESRARELAFYAQKVIADIAAFSATIPEQRKVSVYYAEGLDGLNTDCDKSMHTELINLAGGRNVHRCEARDVFGMEKISLEQIMLYNPDVIFVMEGAFYRKVFADPRWQQIKAVRDKKVYLIPNQPFNWFDRPPSFMRLLGAKWVANLLYPDRYKVDMIKETQRFFKLFLGVDFSPDEAAKLVWQR